MCISDDWFYQCTDLKHLNQALVLLDYYKNSPPFQNPGSAPVVVMVECILSTNKIKCELSFAKDLSFCCIWGFKDFSNFFHSP